MAPLVRKALCRADSLDECLTKECHGARKKIDANHYTIARTRALIRVPRNGMHFGVLCYRLDVGLKLGVRAQCVTTPSAAPCGLRVSIPDDIARASFTHVNTQGNSPTVNTLLMTPVTWSPCGSGIARRRRRHTTGETAVSHAF